MGLFDAGTPKVESSDTTGAFNDRSIDIPESLASNYITVFKPGEGDGFFALPPKLFYIPRDMMPNGVSEEQFSEAVDAYEVAHASGSHEQFQALSSPVPVTVEDVPDPGTQNLSANIIELQNPSEDGYFFVDERSGQFVRYEEDSIPQDMRITHLSDSRAYGIVEWDQGDETIQARVYSGDFVEDFEKLPGVEPLIEGYRRGEYEYPEDMLAYHAEQDSQGNNLFLIPITPKSLESVASFDQARALDLDVSAIEGTEEAPAESIIPLVRP